MQWSGIIIGGFAFLIIGIYHPIVIKCEYYFTSKAWPVFLIVGIVAIIFALLVNGITISSLLGIFGFTNLWTIKELKEQEERVEKGWFPCNPNRKK